MHARTSKAAHHQDVERGRLHASLPTTRGQQVQRATLVLLGFLAVFFIYLVARTYNRPAAGGETLAGLHGSTALHEGAAQGQHGGSAEAGAGGGGAGDVCAQKLAQLGLDFEGSGRTLLSTHAYKRRDTYATMDGQVAIKGLLLGGVITQGLRQADLYHFTHISATHVTISPVLKPLDIPVRATILPLLDAAAAAKVKSAVDNILMPVLPAGSIWRQNHRLYHSTLFHASSHVTPVPASAEEVEQEAGAIKGVTLSTCPIKGVLDRVIVTQSGVIVACWQILPSGTDPADLRQALAHALPRAPGREGQMVKEPSMLHTTIARLLQPPEQLHAQVDPAAVASAVQQLSDTLCGLSTTFNEVWFVEEQDLLALALEGRYLKHVAPLTCPHGAALFETVT